ncbi:hypothetical protein ACGFIF_01215 [Kribbella sp. NPDC049174]|uniref:hypothetical protein n=1 Tax=Kribbella sp. NPDC049174 TaxID=3364112 RepID=UPI00371FFE02
MSQHLLYDPAAWAVLEQAVHDSAATAVVLTERRAYDVPAMYRSRYADLLIAVTTRSEPEVVGHALAALRQWARHNRAAARVCADFVVDLTQLGVWRTAVTALVGIVATNRTTDWTNWSTSCDCSSAWRMTPTYPTRPPTETTPPGNV